MPPATRLGDKAQVPVDAHGCPACPHSAIGPAIAGSPNVLTNQRPAIRLGDPGVHAPCCGPNRWTASQGSPTVFINNQAAVRQGDQTTHCGGMGRITEGSSNVMIGGSTSSGAGGGPPSTQARGPDGGANGNAPAAQASTGSSTAAGDAGSAGAAPASPADKPVEPVPLLVSASWSKAAVPVSTPVTLDAICADLAGTSASFTIRNADDESQVIATLSAACGASAVTASWITPSVGSPGRFVFSVRANGQEAWSGLLTLINTVEVKLVLDDEPAEGIRVSLRIDPSGEIMRAEADAKGVVRFEAAPMGDYTLLLDEPGSEIT